MQRAGRTGSLVPQLFPATRGGIPVTLKCAPRREMGRGGVMPLESPLSDEISSHKSRWTNNAPILRHLFQKKIVLGAALRPNV